jgi:hypothetical protein
MMAFTKTALAVVTLCACTALAAETTDKPRIEERKTIIIHTDGAHQGGMHHGKAGSDHHADMSVAKCGAEPDVDVSDETRDKDGKVRKSRIVLCAREEASGEAVIEKLENARTRIAGEGELSVEAKAKALAAIDAAIARHKERASR